MTSNPRWSTPRQPDRPTRGNLDAAVAELLGWQLFPWQRHVADIAGEFDPITRRSFYRTIGVGVSRQNGKTTLICSRIARQLIPPRQTVAYTAQDRGVARTKWEEHVDLLMATPFAERVARVDRVNHREALVMHNGSRYLPVTPTEKKAARSMSVDLAVIDEAHAHNSMGVIGALQPTMAARANAQIFLLSNAGDADSIMWKHYTEIGRAETEIPGSTMAWFEWAPAPDVDIHDEDAWRDGNPSMGLPGGVLREALADAATGMDEARFRREHLNLWTDTAQLAGIDKVTWAACRDDNREPGRRVAFGLDFTPERDRGALVVAGDTDGVTPLEVIEAGSDLESLVVRAAEVANRWQAQIIIDRSSPAASTIPALERATAYKDRHRKNRHRVRLISTTELARASGDFHDAAISARLTHRGDYRLADAIAAASKRKLSDAWVWKRQGAADISPLIAATMARWGVITAPEPETPPVATVQTRRLTETRITR